MAVDAGLLRELGSVLGPGLLSTPAACVAYECDALTAHRHPPDLVALPTSVEQVQQIVRICRRHAVPVVARGSGTGLSGGALIGSPLGVMISHSLDEDIQFWLFVGYLTIVRGGMITR